MMSNIVIKALDSWPVKGVSDVATVIDTFARATQDPPKRQARGHILYHQQRQCRCDRHHR